MKAARAHKRIHRKSLRLFAIQSQQWRRRERRGGTQLAPPCLFVLVQRRRSVREQPRSQRRRSDNLDPLSRPAALAVSCSAGLLGRSVAPNRFHRRRTFETHRSRNAASLRNPQVSENDNGDTLHGSFNFLFNAPFSRASNVTFISKAFVRAARISRSACPGFCRFFEGH